MIRQQPGDLLEIEHVGNYFYIVVLTRITMFGGNIVFAWHNDGQRRDLESLQTDRTGFNACTDLIEPKREGKVTRIHHFSDTSDFWLTKYAKGANVFRKGEKARLWFLYEITDLTKEIGRYEKLPDEYRSAMDKMTSSFGIIASKIMARYTPDQNERL